jgi:hypothetical protein
MGARWAGKRALYELRRRTGWLERRCPLREWTHYEKQVAGVDLLSNVERFPLRLPKSYAFEAPLAEVDEIRSGRLRLFFNEPVETGWPPRWLEEPGSGSSWAAEHWSRIESLGDRDIKVTWEPGRFSFTWPLLRAHAADPSGDSAELWWTAVDDFRETNPPNAGPHWVCGQEASIRALALAAGLAGFRGAEATTPERVGRLASLLAATADRVEGNLAYALLQKNNHGIVESLGLLLAGHLLEGHGDAVRWREKGRDTLAQEVFRQVYDDGAYVQHSLSYHRFAMEAVTWACVIGDEYGDLVDPCLRDFLFKMAEFLFQVADPATGRMPGYGSNDGARMMRLDDLDPGDARPAIQWAFVVAGQRRVYEDGPWNEPLDWFPGLEPTDRVGPPPLQDLSGTETGYEVVRGADTWAFTRCTTYADRPGQADMTHLDLWWKGHNLVADPGTFAYNASPPWKNGLVSTRVHNCVSVGGDDQMRKGPRFLWRDWTEGRVLRRDMLDEGRVRLLRMEHDGYLAPLGIRCRRAVIATAADLWIVLDDLEGEGEAEHDVSSQWLFPGASVTSPVEDGAALLETPAGPCGFAAVRLPSAGEPVALDVAVHCGGEEDVLGWHSLRYAHKEPALGLVAYGRSSVPHRRLTVIAPGGGVPVVERDLSGIHVRTDSQNVVIDASLLFVRVVDGDA